MTDYMYTSPTWAALAVDPSPFATGVNYRDPAISWAESLVGDDPIEGPIVEQFGAVTP